MPYRAPAPRGQGAGPEEECDACEDAACEDAAWPWPGDASAPGATPAGHSAAQRVVWVYAITNDLGPHQFAGLAGVGGEPVRTVAEAGLTAVVGSVEARAFGEDALASLLDGLDNIERVGRAHHQVIARAAAGGAPVLPLRLATVYPDDDTVRALLARRRGEFAGLLARFRDTVEWGVQIYGPTDQQDGAGARSRTRSTGSWRTSPTPPSGSPTLTRATCKARSR